MKKLLCLFLALIVSLSLLSCNETTVMIKCPSCGELNEVDNEFCVNCDIDLEQEETRKSKDSTSTPKQENASPTQSQAPNNTPTPPNTSNLKLGEFDNTASIQNTVLVDENNIKITATELSYNNYEVKLNLTIENNSNKDLTFISGSIGYSCNSVNGYMVNSSYLNCTVAAGKKTMDSIEFDYDELLLYGINIISDIEIGFDIRDNNHNHTYTGPRQVKSSIFNSYNYSQTFYHETISTQAVMNTLGYDVIHFSKNQSYNINGIKLISTVLMSNQNNNPTILLEFENNTNNIIDISTSKISINGLIVNTLTWSSDTIAPGKRGVFDIVLSSVFDTEYWTIYGLKEIEVVSLSIGQEDSNGKELAKTTSITITIPNTKSELDFTGKEIYNNNGLKIISKAILDDSYNYSNDVHVLLLIKNNSGKELYIDDVYNSLSVNGFMLSWYSYYSLEIGNGECAAIDIVLDDSSLEKINITQAAQIKDIEFKLDIKYNNTKIDTPSIKINY